MSKPILVVGAGPVGLTMAMELARYGVPVRIVDRAPAGSDTSKALAVWRRTLELLDRAGCAEAFVAAGTKARAVRIAASKGPLVRVPLDLPGAFPTLLILPQSETERILDGRLAALGVRVERGVELSRFTDDGEAVTAGLRHADGTEEQVEASWLVGCDGAHSTVRHGLGLDFAGDTLPGHFILADVRVDGLEQPEDELAMFWHEDGLLAFFPFSHGRYRIIGDVGADAPGELDLAQLQAMVRRRAPGTITLSDCAWLSTFRINERKVRDYRAGRVFLAGDAAHVHSPAGGQGMNTGMQDAFNLAWKLALVEGGRADARLLDSYSAERSPVAADVLAQSGRLTRLAMARNHIVQAMRNFVAHHLLGIPGVQHELAERLSETSIRYPASSFIDGNAPRLAAPAPGERIVATLPFGGGDRARFALMARRDAATLALLRDHAALLEPEPRDPPEGDHAWLVRPDGHVAAVDHAGDLRAIRAVLDRVAA